MSEREPTPLDRACLALTAAVVATGDRYHGRGRKAVANDFYNLLALVADVRKAGRNQAAAIEGTETNGYRNHPVAAND